MQDLWIGMVEWALTSLTGIAAIALWRALKRLRREFDAVRRGQQMQLRADLVALHRRWIAEKGYMPVDEKRFFEDMFEAYEALGENGIISGLYRDVQEAHVAPNPNDHHDTHQKEGEPE